MELATIGLIGLVTMFLVGVNGIYENPNGKDHLYEIWACLNTEWWITILIPVEYRCTVSHLRQP